jgi:hypothetical protein
MTLLSAILFRLDDPMTAWQRMADGLRFFASNNSSSGIARGLAMAAIIQLRHGDPALATRAAAKA